MNCKCGTEMIPKYKTPNYYDDMFLEIYWCPDCGSLLEIHEDGDDWVIPAITNQSEKKMSLIESKINLYHELLKINSEKISENDISIGFLLSQDPSIQNILSTADENERR